MRHPLSGPNINTFTFIFINTSKTDEHINDLFEYRIEKDRLLVPLKNNGV